VLAQVPFKHLRHEPVRRASHGGKLLQDGIAFRAVRDGRFHCGNLSLQSASALQERGPVSLHVRHENLDAVYSPLV
jgi:hypothetical protein